MEDFVIEVLEKSERGMIENGSKIPSVGGLLPKGERLIVGEKVTVCL